MKLSHKTIRILKIATFAALINIQFPLFAATLQGEVERINDGDTFKIWGQPIRLKGIDAPESAQLCRDNKGQEYPCGDYSTNYLKELIRGREVTCEGSERDGSQRLLATCYVGDININQTMVDNGWAVAFVKYDTTYIQEEKQAESAKRGIWQGEFVRPADYRSGAWVEAETTAKGQGQKCLIKGNINANGDRIYHTPWGSKHYNRTKINIRKGERWFCTEEGAMAAGWRAPDWWR